MPEELVTLRVPREWIRATLTEGAPRALACYEWWKGLFLDGGHRRPQGRDDAGTWFRCSREEADRFVAACPDRADLLQVQP